MGAPDDATRWNARAAELRTTLQTKLVAPGGYLGRGSKNGNVDTRLEIANLALGSGGFGIFPDTDPRVASVGDLVASRLQTPSGAVRRYEGDEYYGGHPWPVAAEWLSMHRLARGDRAGAEKLFGVMTSEALTTESKMLGEQFDEENEKWVSAMPLVWSEAAYVHAALALYSP
jgi:GH15 family glucan-1,4-alpha-glucosidase